MPILAQDHLTQIIVGDQLHNAKYSFKSWNPDAFQSWNADADGKIFGRPNIFGRPKIFWTSEKFLCDQASMALLRSESCVMAVDVVHIYHITTN